MIERTFNATLLIIYSALIFGEAATLVGLAVIVAGAGVADIIIGGHNA